MAQMNADEKKKKRFVNKNLPSLSRAVVRLSIGVICGSFPPYQLVLNRRWGR